jgi:hypothetical protein
VCVCVCVCVCVQDSAFGGRGWVGGLCEKMALLNQEGP